MKQNLLNLKFLDDNIYLSKKSKENIIIYLKNKYIKLHGGAFAAGVVALSAIAGVGLGAGAATTQNWVENVNTYQEQIDTINGELEEMLAALHGRMDFQRDNAIQLNQAQDQTNQNMIDLANTNRERITTVGQTQAQQGQINQAQEETNQTQTQVNQVQGRINQTQAQINQTMTDLIEERITTIRQQISIIEKNTLEFKTELEKKVDLSNSELKGLLDAQSSTLLETINRVKELIDSDIDTIKDDLQNVIVSFNTNIGNLRLEIDTTISQLIGAINGEMEILNRKDEAQDKEIAKLTQENIRLNESIKSNRLYLKGNTDKLSQILDIQGILIENQEFSHKLIYELQKRTDQISEDSKIYFEEIISKLQREKEEIISKLQKEKEDIEKRLQEEITVTREEIEINAGNIEGNTGNIAVLYQQLAINYNNLKTMILNNSNYLRYQNSVVNRNKYFQDQFNYTIDTKVNLNKQEINDKLEQYKKELVQINRVIAQNLLDKINHVEQAIIEERTVRHQGSQNEQRIRKAQIKSINKRINIEEKKRKDQIEYERLNRISSDEDINERIDREVDERIKRAIGINKRIDQETLDRKNEIEKINKEIKKESTFVSSVLYSQIGQENEDRIDREKKN